MKYLIHYPRVVVNTQEPIPRRASVMIGDMDRPADEVIERLKQVSPNDVGHHRHFGFPSASIEYMQTAGSLTMVGPVLTVRIPPEDSVMVHKATELAQPGDVIAVDMQGHTEHAPWGEMTTRGAIQSGAAGAIIDGSITDSRDIDALGFPVYARGRSARTTRLHGRGGDVNVPIQIGGAVVEPGDIVVGNEDGLVFVPPGAAERVIELGREASEAEERTLAQLEAGDSIPEITQANQLIAEMDDT
jgi:regulator of RNase E activity RraA